MTSPGKAMEAISIEDLHKALDRIHRRACDGKSAPPYMSVPADPRRDADLMLSNAIDELSALRAELETVRRRNAELCQHIYDQCCGTPKRHVYCADFLTDVERNPAMDHDDARRAASAKGDGECSE